MRLIKILQEAATLTGEKELIEKESPNPFSSELVPITSGRPSQFIKDMKGLATSKPEKLLADLGIGTITGKGQSEKVYNILLGCLEGQQMTKFKEIFVSPTYVKSPSESRVGILVKLSPEGKKFVTAEGKKAIREFVFWFQSAIIAANIKYSVLGELSEQHIKIRFVPTGGILIYLGNKPWKTL